MEDGRLGCVAAVVERSAYRPRRGLTALGGPKRPTHSTTTPPCHPMFHLGQRTYQLVRAQSGTFHARPIPTAPTWPSGLGGWMRILCRMTRAQRHGRSGDTCGRSSTPDWASSSSRIGGIRQRTSFWKKRTAFPPCCFPGFENSPPRWAAAIIPAADLWNWARSFPHSSSGMVTCSPSRWTGMAALPPTGDEDPGCPRGISACWMRSPSPARAWRCHCNAADPLAAAKGIAHRELGVKGVARTKVTLFDPNAAPRGGGAAGHHDVTLEMIQPWFLNPFAKSWRWHPNDWEGAFYFWTGGIQTFRTRTRLFGRMASRRFAEQRRLPLLDGWHRNDIGRHTAFRDGWHPNDIGRDRFFSGIVSYKHVRQTQPELFSLLLLNNAFTFPENQNKQSRCARNVTPRSSSSPPDDQFC